MKRYHVWLLLLPTLVLCCLIIFRVCHRPEFLKNEQKVRDLESQKIQNDWDNQEYILIANNEAFKKEVIDLPILSNGVQLTADQTSQIRLSVYNFLMAYHEGNYESYKQFRMPSAGYENPKYVPYEKKQILKVKTNLLNLDSLSPSDVFKQYVGIKSGETYYKDYFASLCVTNAKIEIEEVSKQLAPLNDYVWEKTRNRGVATHDPLYLFNNSPSTVLTNYGKLLYATIALYIKTSESARYQMAAPFYLRFYWEPKSMAWLPIQLVVGNIEQNSDIKIVF